MFPRDGVRSSLVNTSVGSSSFRFPPFHNLFKVSGQEEEKEEGKDVERPIPPPPPPPPVEVSDREGRWEGAKSPSHSVPARTPSSHPILGLEWGGIGGERLFRLSHPLLPP